MVETKQKENQYEDTLIQDKEQKVLNQEAFNSEGSIRPYWDHVESHFEDYISIICKLDDPETGDLIVLTLKRKMVFSFFWMNGTFPNQMQFFMSQLPTHKWLIILLTKCILNRINKNILNKTIINK